MYHLTSYDLGTAVLDNLKRGVKVTLSELSKYRKLDTLSPGDKQFPRG
jgi:hypothetical protein